MVSILSRAEQAVEDLWTDCLLYWHFSPRQPSKADTFALAQQSLSTAKEVLMYGSDLPFLEEMATKESLSRALGSGRCYIGAIIPEGQQNPLDRLAKQYWSVQVFPSEESIENGFLLIDRQKAMLWDSRISTNFLPEYNTGICYRQLIENKRLSRQLHQFFWYNQSLLGLKAKNSQKV